jgi:DNA-directed RNA polymerase subunit RPC12/RpoP
MSNSTYFVQECPTCGRRLQVRVEYLGKKVVCQHCRGRFVASDPASGRYSPSDSAILMRRAEELLHDAAETDGHCGERHPR